MEAGTLATQHACATLTPFREIQPNPMLDFGCGRVARIVVGRVARIEYTVPDTSLDLHTRTSFEDGQAQKHTNATGPHCLSVAYSYTYPPCDRVSVIDPDA